MQFSAILNIFIVKTKLNSTFTNDLKRKENFWKNVHSYRVCSFKYQTKEFDIYHTPYSQGHCFFADMLINLYCKFVFLKYGLKYMYVLRPLCLYLNYFF